MTAASSSSSSSAAFFKPAAKIARGPAGNSHQPWIEKYRPKDMSQISSQDEVVQVLRNTIESKNLPHLLFYGPPGTGKTSTILALAKELYGPELFKTRVLELNASDERGIDIVREKVKNFARTTVSGSASGYSCPPYKIIILDEADSMTTDAQSALRRTMETYSKITRFCLICNYVSRIIEPLASRCAKFRFKAVDVGSMKSRLNMICESENVVCSPESIDTLIDVSEGDLRKAIMFLQTASRLHAGDTVTPESLVEIAGIVPQRLIKTLLDAVMNKRFDPIQVAVKELILEGFGAGQVLSQFHDMIISSMDLTSMQKSKICLILGKIDKYLLDGSDEELQMMSMASQMAAAC